MNANFIFPALPIADNVSLDVDYEGPPIRVIEQNIINIQFNWVGTLSGKIEIQASNDQVIWTPLPEFPITINNTNTAMYNYSQFGWYWIRVVYTSVSGSGTLTAILAGK